MKLSQKFIIKFLLAIIVIFIPVAECPAPLIWQKGEGWTYKGYGKGSTGKNPTEQLTIGKRFQQQEDYSHAISAYRRVIRKWPTAGAAQESRYRLAECLAARGNYYKAFKMYQELIDKYPNTEHFDAVLQRQFEIGNHFFEGGRDKALGMNLFGSIENAAEIFEQVVRNGPFSEIAPEAQFRIGLTREKQTEYSDAILAYESLLERYPNHTRAEDAQFRIGIAYMQQAKESEYDQSLADLSIHAFADFLARYPTSEKASLAHEHFTVLSEEQSRGLFKIGQYYEKRKRYPSALIYYNAVIDQMPNSTWAGKAKDKVARLSASSTRVVRPSP